MDEKEKKKFWNRKNKRKETAKAALAERGIRDPWPDMGVRVCKAKAMLEMGESVRAVEAAAGLARATVEKIKRGDYDKTMPSTTLTAFRNAERGKRIVCKAMILDEILENPDKVKEATLNQLAVAYGILFDKEALDEGRPTQIVEHITTLSDEELHAKIREDFTTLAQRVRERGMIDASVTTGELVDTAMAQIEEECAG